MDVSLNKTIISLERLFSFQTYHFSMTLEQAILILLVEKYQNATYSDLLNI